MLPASLRYALLAAVIVCNALFFWDVEFEADSLLAMAFGTAPAPQAQRTDTRLTQTRIEQSKAYTFSNPTHAPGLSH